jgi:hypothetical protein
MPESKTSNTPQDCPKYGASAVVNNPKPRLWYVACSKNSKLIGGHRVEGHTMLTKREAITVWNELN